MAENKEREDEQAILTNNVIQSGEILGIGKSHWIEALIFAIIATWLVRRINFVDDIKFAVSLIIFSVVFYFTLRGFRNRTITQILIEERKFRKNKRELHLTDVSVPRKGYNDNGESEQGISDFEKVYRRAKKYYSKIREKLNEE